jgi:hypothetical protein
MVLFEEEKKPLENNQSENSHDKNKYQARIAVFCWPKEIITHYTMGRNNF